MVVGKFLLRVFLIFIGAKIALSGEILHRLKRDKDYHVKCHQSYTGMFSFFAIPILLGDITLDFMSMVNVMVDVMVTATNTNTMTGNNNNNNMNTNMNSNGRRRRRRRRGLDKRSLVDEAALGHILESFLEKDGDTQEVHQDYQQLAQLHIDNYFQLMNRNADATDQKKSQAMIEPSDLIGERNDIDQKQRTAILDYTATHFFERLLEKFHEFKESCIVDKKAECVVLDQSF